MKEVVRTDFMRAHLLWGDGKPVRYGSKIGPTIVSTQDMEAIVELDDALSGRYRDWLRSKNIVTMCSLVDDTDI